MKYLLRLPLGALVGLLIGCGAVVYGGYSLANAGHQGIVASGPLEAEIGTVESEYRGQVELTLEDQGGGTVNLMVTSATDRATAQLDLVPRGGHPFWRSVTVSNALIIAGGALLCLYVAIALFKRTAQMI